MKRTCTYAVMLILIVGTACARDLRAQAAAPSPSTLRELHASFDPLFQAMKNGDVAVIEQYFSGQMSSEYKKLLEENQEYPNFLRNFYKGATFSIVNVTPTSDGDMLVDVAIQLGGGSRSVTRLTAKRFDGSPARWRVMGLVKAARLVSKNPSTR